MPFTPVSERPGLARAPELAGAGVLLTRPKDQCHGLMARLADLGAHARCLPVVEIEAPLDPAPAKAALRALAGFDFLVFNSVNAVRGALAVGPGGLAVPAGVRVAAVGPATRRALKEAGIGVTIVPDLEFSSEGLLAHPSLAPELIRGRRVLIVKGEGGRAHLAASLESAGAAVERVDVYRRSQPEVRIPGLLGEPLSRFEFLVLTSGTAMEHLLGIATQTERRQILDMRLVVPSERIARIARQGGVRTAPAVASGPGDAQLVEALLDLHGGQTR